MIGGAPVGGFGPASLALMIGSQVVGNMMKADANDDAARRRTQFSDAMRQYQIGQAKNAEAATERFIAKQTPEARAAELVDLTELGQQSLRDTVGAAQAFDTAPGGAPRSADYGEASAAAAERVAERTRQAIEQLAAMRAPGEQRVLTAKRYSLAAGDVGAANSAIAAAQRAGLTDIDAVAPDPDEVMLGDIVSGVGSGLGSVLAKRPGSVVTAGGSGIDPTTAGQGLRVGASGTGLKPRVANAFSLWGGA